MRAGAETSAKAVFNKRAPPVLVAGRRPVASVTGAGFLTAHCRCAAGEPLTRGRPRRAGNLGRNKNALDFTAGMTGQAFINLPSQATWAD